MRIYYSLLSMLFSVLLFSSCQQENKATTAIVYSISFDNAVHHEAEINVTFSDVAPGKFAFRMSRTSPGRYALHEFAKNVYNVKATNSAGEALKITRPDPYQWVVESHDGTVHVSYTLFANRGGGTYAQVDETHAHLNIPATFMFAPSQAERPVEVTFNVREDLNWKVATQLKKESGNTFSAPDLQYFMDSPTEVSDHQIRSFDVDSNGKTQTVHFVLHHNGTDAELDTYFEDVKAIVLQQKAVYGELPDFDFGEYRFLACYIPNASGDGMEHRNSTILTTTRSLAQGGAISTVSHEFFHAWNVERIRPKSLEPFDFEEANMSGELWFAEGFTSYYTGLILLRADVWEQDRYLRSIASTFNYVWNSPGTKFFNPIEMSYQAPFVDAARSVDPVNRGNTFISYYSYGSTLGLALDLALRNEPGNLNLDDYMKLVWKKFGKEEVPYTIENLNQALNAYAGEDFGNAFFNKYIYDSKMPNYKTLLASVGVSLTQKGDTPYFGARIRQGRITNEPTIGCPAYKAGLDRGDQLISVNGKGLNDKNTFSAMINTLKPGDIIDLVFTRHGVTKNTRVTLGRNPRYTIESFEKEGKEVTDAIKVKRTAWLGKK
ncbi:PDZ domain-containing protein [Flavobacteriaceae bacterium S356]|uniref:PDZ domain-containing protein n=1 Tax=Asprobacillus argus TaxID=3076534 RepID=A0ABU3LC39_9FLAO|nr:PDZ domain-containing protein [Flavobacteriaceae bacterium S356]